MTVSTQLQSHAATRQSTNYIYRNTDEEVTIELVTDHTDHDSETVLALFEIALTHTSDIPASIADLRQVTR